MAKKETSDKFVHNISIFKKAAEQGNSEAQFILGMCYYKGDGVKNDPQKAAYWIQKAAEQGDANAQAFLGMCYDIGKGVNKNRETSAYWYQKAAEQGIAEAQYAIGMFYFVGKGVTADIEKAAYWLQKAYAQDYFNPDGNAFFVIGVYHLRYYKKNGGDKNIKTAMHWLLKAAELGNADAQYNIAMCYYSGEGVNADFKLAADWFYKAALQGDAEAQFKLSMCYLKGAGVEKNIKTAAGWFPKSTEQGDVGSQDFLDIYHKQDACEVPKEDGKKFLKAVKEKEAQEEKKKAEKEREQWIPQGLCSNCGGQFGLLGKCKNCGADKLLGFRTSEEWKEIIAKATRQLEIRIKNMSPSQRLSAIREVQNKIVLETGHLIELVRKIYEKYANKSVQKEIAFRK